jgi:hypothetical protein
MDAPPSEIAATAETVHHMLVAMSVQSDRVCQRRRAPDPSGARPLDDL